MEVALRMLMVSSSKASIPKGLLIVWLQICESHYHEILRESRCELTEGT
jgi:hypothetical protein